ncbi:GNAT family N-acetyltransferase [Actinophytocola sp.]|uniref:GNAT family N-acetyltransferase n=1 Tax=Actinophytocola sp. TaxID=1872138 RepID=UPI002ED7EEE9
MNSGEAEQFTVGVATREDWEAVVELANAEGWNVGHHDADCFLSTDPEGFFVGKLGDRVVSAVSLVTYGDSYGVWGNYVVHPDFRGRGLGRATCKAARRHGGDRMLASDAMPDRVENYQRSGLVPVHDTVNYVGHPERGVNGGTAVRVGLEHLDAVIAYDAQSFPAERDRFLRNWLTSAGHTAYVRVVDGRITGYGVIRTAPRCQRIGPLVADTPEDAEALFDALTADLGPDEEVSVFAPQSQDSAGSFFTDRGLAEQFRVVRMYTGDVPSGEADRVLAIGSLELG